MAEARRGDAGGILGLHRLLIEHGEAVEADLHRYHRLTLADLTSGRLTMRLCWAYLRALPADAATMRAVRGEDWSLTEHLLAAAVDALNAGNWQRANVGAKHPSARPQPLPRPGDPAPPRRRPVVDAAAHRAWLDRHGARLADLEVTGRG